MLHCFTRRREELEAASSTSPSTAKTKEKKCKRPASDNDDSEEGCPGALSSTLGNYKSVVVAENSRKDAKRSQSVQLGGDVGNRSRPTSMNRQRSS